MKLMTKKIEKELSKYSLYSQDGKGMQATTMLKFFLPVGRWTWYVTEAEKQTNGDWLFYGLVINNYGEKEFGYFSLSELAKIRVMGGLIGIERDMYFDVQTLANAVA